MTETALAEGNDRNYGSTVLISIVGTIIFVLLTPVAAAWQLYDWLEDRRFERETTKKYGAHP
jgi:hypothetical protein